MTADRYNRSDLSSQALKAWQNAHPQLAPDFGEPRPITLCHDYDKEIPMSDDKLTPQELRGEFAALHTEIANIRTALAAVQGDGGNVAESHTGSCYNKITIQRG